MGVRSGDTCEALIIDCEQPVLPEVILLAVEWLYCQCSRWARKTALNEDSGAVVREHLEKRGLRTFANHADFKSKPWDALF